MKKKNNVEVIEFKAEIEKINRFENGNEVQAEAETLGVLKMEIKRVMSPEDLAARFEDGKEREMTKGAKEGKDW